MSSPTEIRPLVPLPEILRVFLGIGLQSWGGGTATFALIQRTVTHTQGWMTDAEFARAWAIAHLSPGINLISLTVLLGRRLAGRWGPAATVAGLLVPSAAVTLIITALYALVRDSAQVKAAFTGVLPATVGIGAYSALRTVRPLLRESHAQGIGVLAVDLCLIAACVAAVALLHIPTVAVVILGASLSGLFHWLRLRRRTSVESAD